MYNYGILDCYFFIIMFTLYNLNIYVILLNLYIDLFIKNVKNFREKQYILILFIIFVIQYNIKFYKNVIYYCYLRLRYLKLSIIS